MFQLKHHFSKVTQVSSILPCPLWWGCDSRNEYNVRLGLWLLIDPWTWAACVGRLGSSLLPESSVGHTYRCKGGHATLFPVRFVLWHPRCSLQSICCLYTKCPAVLSRDHSHPFEDFGITDLWCQRSIQLTSFQASLSVATSCELVLSSAKFPLHQYTYPSFTTGPSLSPWLVTL